MADSDANLLRRVLAQITSLRKNLPSEPEQSDADRFHEQLDRLQQAGYDVAEFRLHRERDMYRRWLGSTGWPGYSDAVHYHADTYSVQPGVLEAKMDAILTYFELERGDQAIGFHR